MGKTEAIKEAIIHFLSENKGKWFFKEQIFSAVKDQIKSFFVKPETVYRVLRKLVEEGIVRRLEQSKDRVLYSISDDYLFEQRVIEFINQNFVIVVEGENKIKVYKKEKEEFTFRDFKDAKLFGVYQDFEEFKKLVIKSYFSKK